MITRISGFHDLHRVIYVSKAIGEANAEPAACVDAIVKASMENNRRVNVTGALLACDGWFIQVLEGRRIDVDGILQRITYDRRHAEIQRLESGPVDNRQFALWSMCAGTLSATDEEIVQVLANSGTFDPRKLRPEMALDLLCVVTRLQEIRAARVSRPTPATLR